MSLSYAEQLDKSSRRLEVKTRDGLFDQRQLYFRSTTIKFPEYETVKMCIINGRF